MLLKKSQRKTRYLGHRYFQTVSFMMKATDVTIDTVFRNFSIYRLNKLLSYFPQKNPNQKWIYKIYRESYFFVMEIRGHISVNPIKPIWWIQLRMHPPTLFFALFLPM